MAKFQKDTYKDRMLLHMYLDMLLLLHVLLILVSLIGIVLEDLNLEDFLIC